jgi:hypothetical protein
MYGDADLDDDVDLDDVGNWATNFTGELGGTGTKRWFEGDWDYDSDVDLDDVGRWSGNFTGELGGGVSLALPAGATVHPQALGALREMGIAVVPESNLLLPLANACCVLAVQRRRRRP